jgi:hypothetical protein
VAANGHEISDDYGSSVERTAALHPLWQVLTAASRLVKGRGCMVGVWR